MRRAVFPQMLYHRPRRCNVSSRGPKRLGEGAHQNVHITEADPHMLAHSPPGGSHGTNRMSLVYVQIRPILVLHFDDSAQVTYLQTYCAGAEAQLAWSCKFELAERGRQVVAKQRLQRDVYTANNALTPVMISCQATRRRALGE